MVFVTLQRNQPTLFVMANFKEQWVVLDQRNHALIKCQHQHLGYELTTEPRDAMRFDRIGDAMRFVATINHYQPKNYKILAQSFPIEETIIN